MANPQNNPTTFDRRFATGIPSGDQLSSLEATHRKYARSYKENRRKTRMFKLAKRAAWVLFGADVWFSYQGITAFSGSGEFALFVAAFVGAGQWVVSESILSRSLGGLMKLDANTDGEITTAEWTRWAIHLSALLTVYGLDIATNLAAINGEVLGTLPFTIAGDEAARSVPTWVAWMTSLLICTILCFADEWIHSISDTRLAELEEELPGLKEKAFYLEARQKEAGAYGEVILNKAAVKGAKRGETY
ncbi:MAG: hypothetical protein AAFX78_04810 [Cyanobacteria bacterium J06638_20]